jgi:hypothetical protein
MLLAGCTGIIGGPPLASLSSTDAEQVAVSGLRRLSKVELDATVRELLGDDQGRARRLLPADSTDPFDNDYRLQTASGALVEAAEALAVELSDAALADAQLRARLLPCQPTGPSDSGCLRVFVETFGRRAFRRPLLPEEVDRFMTLQPYAVEAADFDFGVKLVIRAMLQHPAFLYRVELGEPVSGQPGLFRLTRFELATRLSYFLVGTTPPDWLLDEVAAGTLDTKEGVQAAAKRLLSEPLARGQIERFHALWLGYHRLPHALPLTQAMQQESDALVDRVVFTEGSDYFTLFTSSDSFVNATLATQYGLTGFTGGTGFQWLPYGSAPRKGLLSHGSVLSQGVKFADSSPTQRGIFVRNRLLCQEIPPPPAGVNVDEAPVSTSPCKKARYTAHASGGCKGCHDTVDPIGFGLERFDREGRYRTTDDGLPNCPIEGQGSVVGAPAGDLAFSGPDGLADALIASGAFEKCVVTQVFRFSQGRREGANDIPAILERTETFKAGQRNFQALLLDVVSDETFAFRREEEVP